MKALYKTLPLDKIVDPERPLRSDLSPESVADLVPSIKQLGIIEPLVVFQKGELFEVIAGHRRLLAAEIAGLAIVPCMVTEVSGMDAEILKLHENLARSEINPIDWAKHLDYLKSQYNLTIAKLAELLGMSEAWVGQHLEILKYPAELLDALAEDKVSFSAARELVQIKDEGKRKMHVEYAVKGGVSPAMAAKWRREANSPTLQYPSSGNSSGGSYDEPVGSNIVGVCPVCNENIPLEESVTITIHHYCLPKTP